MSTRELAISIIDSMTEEELNEFVLRYKSEREQGAEKANDLSEKRQAFLEIQKMRKKVPGDFDYKKELAEYRDERYGN